MAGDNKALVSVMAAVFSRARGCRLWTVARPEDSSKPRISSVKGDGRTS
jgi:hypothetical protein